MVVVDATLDPDWDDGVSTDGLADVVFWGHRGAEVGSEPLTSPGEGGVLGWRGLPLAEAERIARDLEAPRPQEKFSAVDLRPHTEQWRLLGFLESLRQSRTGSIEIERDGARLISSTPTPAINCAPSAPTSTRSGSSCASSSA